MNNNKTLTSFQGSSLDSTADLTNNQLRESETKKIEHACSFMCVIQSRLTFIIGKFKEENEARRGNMTQPYVDAISANQDCKTKLDELWTAIKRIQFKSAGLRAAKFSIIGLELISKQRRHQFDAGCSTQELSIPGIEHFIENIHTLGIQLVNESEKLKNLYQEEENEVHKFTVRQHSIVELITDMVQHIEKVADSCKINEEESNKNKERDIKTKIAAAIFNILLSKHDIDFDQHPDLVELKTKWRRLSQQIN